MGEQLAILVQRVILVADHGLLSVDKIVALTALADKGRRKLEFILAVPALAFDRGEPETGLAKAAFADHRLIVAHDPLRTAEQGDRQRARSAELEHMAQRMVAMLDAQDEGEMPRGRHSYSHLTRAVAEAELTRLLKADFTADRFSWSVDEEAFAQAALFDGKFALLTNAPDSCATDVVARKKTLADIERGFCGLKYDTEIASVHNRLPDRIHAHPHEGEGPQPQREPPEPRSSCSPASRSRAPYGISRTPTKQLKLFDAMNLPKPA